NPLSSNRYGAGSPLPVRSVSMPTAMPMQTAPGNGAFIPAGPMPAGIGMPAAGAPLGRPLDPSLMGQPAYPSYPLSAPQIPVQPGHTGMPPGAGPMPSASIGWAPVNLPPMATEDYFDTMLTAGLDGTIDGPNVVRIPVRIGPGETPQIREGDITLEDGDIVFIEARSSEVFYTGGLLGGGQFTLPRDYDLRALEALSIAQAGGSRGGVSKSVGGVSALNQDVTISASKLIVVRKLVDGTSVPIEVDLNHAKQDMTGRENIIIQPGDYLYLQYSCLEAVGAFFERHLLEGALFGLATAQFQSNGN
ncbi:MAG: hypothetical protein KDA75_18110, partial [Planctomycetaceae bacterium]|nr:hypothetical protein [Planctomycetaceae bacterium]